MAPIFHLANRILLVSEGVEASNRQVYLKTLIDMKENETKASELLVSNAADLLTGTRFLTISSSGSVLSSLIAIAQKRRISVMVMRSMPGGEGTKAAELLSDRGVRVELIDDSMVFDIARKCDAGLCGADSISLQGVVNKVGTYSLAMACDESGIGCHVLATWSKCTPITPTEMMITRRSINGIDETEQIFELVPSKRFDSCINEDGSSPMSQLITRIQDMPLAESWKGMLPI